MGDGFLYRDAEQIARHYIAGRTPRSAPALAIQRRRTGALTLRTEEAVDIATVMLGYRVEHSCST